MRKVEGNVYEERDLSIMNIAQARKFRLFNPAILILKFDTEVDFRVVSQSEVITLINVWHIVGHWTVKSHQSAIHQHAIVEFTISFRDLL